MEHDEACSRLDGARRLLGALIVAATLLPFVTTHGGASDSLLHEGVSDFARSFDEWAKTGHAIPATARSSDELTLMLYLRVRAVTPFLVAASGCGLALVDPRRARARATLAVLGAAALASSVMHWHSGYWSEGLMYVVMLPQQIALAAVSSLLVAAVSTDARSARPLCTGLAIFTFTLATLEIPGTVLAFGVGERLLAFLLSVALVVEALTRAPGHAPPRT